MNAITSKVRIHDPFGAAHDAALPTLARALDPETVNEAFRHALPQLAGEGGRVSVRSITVTRHKPGKRCVIEYGVRVKHADAPWAHATVIGKVRARRFGNEAFRLQELIWEAGFQGDSADGISVPEPLGVIPQFQMWLQRKVPGFGASAVLAGSEGVAQARRIAEAIDKLHRAGVPTPRAHLMADELRILHECLPTVARRRPDWSGRIDRLLVGCDRLGARVPAPRLCGIHRDFYPAQVIVDGGRIHLLDFDLYCEGDPGLDVGNFLGHTVEESLRTSGDAHALREREQALEERFLELAGVALRPSVRAYTTLTLARHVYLSTQFPERQAFTEQLLELCEQRLG